MRVQRKEIKKPNSERVRFAITELTEKEFITLCRALFRADFSGEKEAGEMLKTFEEVAEFYY